MPNPTPPKWPRLMALGLLAAAVSGLGACGRAGPLEPPPAAAPSPAATPTPDAADPAAGFRHPKAAPITPPTRALPIDPLL